MIKRLMLLLAVLALVAAACGGTSDTEETTTTAATDDGTTETTAGSTDDGGGDAGQGSEGGTLATVQARGKLICGVSGSAVAFSETQSDGSATGFDADYCRAVAAAVLGDANAVEFRALTAAERFEALKNNEIDVLIRNTTWTQSRDTDIGMDFAPTTFYDGQQVMGRRDKGFTEDSTLADVDGAILCTNAGTTTEKNITEGAALSGATITLETVETFPEAMEKFIAGTCDLTTTDGSGLVGNKATQDTNDEWVIFPRAPISKEPLGPVYRQNDSQWGDIINWTVYATIIADENDVTSANASQDDERPEISRLFGGEGELQTKMGLEADAFFQVITQVGNYDEIFSRNLNPVGLFREGTFNAPFNEGGMIFAPPAR
ncbi:MAG: amino acid ABC transporter substrate-binding protein [bacterium]|nr:amino acid ABC transporter substrate-binding protein [bacterium]MCP4965799.1 amino acid ABC transporter substrate-binding protein [bacterium]